MADEDDFVEFFSRPHRTDKEKRQMERFLKRQRWMLSDEEIEEVCSNGVIKHMQVGNILYRKGDNTHTWHMLLSGNVIIGNALFSAPICLGKEKGDHRKEDCIVLDPSDVIFVENREKDETSCINNNAHVVENIDDERFKKEYNINIDEALNNKYYNDGDFNKKYKSVDCSNYNTSNNNTGINNHTSNYNKSNIKISTNNIHHDNKTFAMGSIHLDIDAKDFNNNNTNKNKNEANDNNNYNSCSDDDNTFLDASSELSCTSFTNSLFIHNIPHFKYHKKEEEEDGTCIDDDNDIKRNHNNNNNHNNKNNNSNIDDDKFEKGDRCDRVVRRLVKSHSFGGNDSDLQVFDLQNMENHPLQQSSSSSASSSFKQQYKRNHNNINNNNNSNYNIYNNNNTNNYINNSQSTNSYTTLYNNTHISPSDTSSVHSDNFSSFIESVIDSEMNLAHDEDEDDDDDVYNEDDYNTDRINRPDETKGVGRLVRVLGEGRTPETSNEIYNFLKHQPALSSLSEKAKRKISDAVRMMTVDGVLMNKGDQMTDWMFLLDGFLEVVDGESGDDAKILQPGNCLGTEPLEVLQYCPSTIKTSSKPCILLSIPQSQYLSILKAENKNLREVVENDEVVAVFEEKEDQNGTKEHILIRATPDYLLKNLFDPAREDPSYMGTFLLTYRTFFRFPSQLAYKLMDFFDAYKSKVVALYLSWMTSFPEDFEQDVLMNTSLQHLTENLRKEGMDKEIEELDNKFATISKAREVVVLRSCRDEELPFHILNHPQHSSSTFITYVDEKASKLGLRVGDEILEVNKRSFNNIRNSEALSLMTSHTHLSLLVKSNKPGLKRMLSLHKKNKKSSMNEKSSKKSTSSIECIPPTKSFSSSARSSITNRLHSRPPSVTSLSSQTHCPIVSHLPLELEEDSNPRVISRIKESLSKLLVSKNTKTGMPSKGRFTSQPDLYIMNKKANKNKNNVNRDKYNTIKNAPGFLESTSLQGDDASETSGRNESEDGGDIEVVKIFREDQTYKYLPVDKYITAKQAVMLVLQKFGMTDKNSLEYFLYKVTLQENGCIKTSRLPNHSSNLVSSASLRSRYYLKNENDNVDLIPSHVVEEFKKECQTNFLNLSPSQIAIQLTIINHKCYSRIRSSEFISHLFNIKTCRCSNSSGASGSRNSTLEKQSEHDCPFIEDNDFLQKFSKIPNHELFWVVTQILSESSSSSRAKTISHFTRIAKHCIECKNFNSAFNIISGLGHQSISRLKQTWDKVPEKTTKLFESIQGNLDPCRNMQKYRQLIASRSPPLIPFYPMVIKDLTALQLNNKTLIDGLINFQKLRMIAKEINKFKSYAPDEPLSESHLSSMLKNKNNSTILTSSLSATQDHNLKKIFDQRRMAKRIDEYLSGVNPIEVEAQLSEMSNCCEGGAISRFETSSITHKTNTTPRFGCNSPSQFRKLQVLSNDNKPNLLSLSKLRQSVENLATAHHSSNVTVARTSSNKLSFSTGKKEAGFNLVKKIKQKDQIERHRAPSRGLKGHIETDSGRFSYSGDDRSTGSSNSNHGSPPSVNKPRPAPSRPPQPRLSQNTTDDATLQFDFSNFYRKKSSAGDADVGLKMEKRKSQNLIKKLSNQSQSSSSSVRVSINKETNLISFQTKPVFIHDAKKPPSGRDTKNPSHFFHSSHTKTDLL